MEQQSQTDSGAGVPTRVDPLGGSHKALSDVTANSVDAPANQGCPTTQQHTPRLQVEQQEQPQSGSRPADAQPHRGASYLQAAPQNEATQAEPRQDARLPTQPPGGPSTASVSVQHPVTAEGPTGGQCGQDFGTVADQDAEKSMPAGPGPEPLLSAPLTHPNGVSMFPSMSPSEQEGMAREALSQAEASIVAESFEDEPIARDDESDGGYSSDGFSSGSTSAESSIRDYLYENGRRYHRFREGCYNFPNDDVEQEREDMKHAMMKLLCNQKLLFAPIGNHPQEILDIGTGTGIWAIEVGDEFASAHVLGVDLSPIQPDWLPPNVRFLVDDIESPWLYPRNHFDYIHSRHTVMAIRDWGRLFRRAYEHLKPGGWIELQEIHHKPRSAHPDGVVPADHPVAQFWARVNEGLTALGIDLDTAAGGLLANMMRGAGLCSVTERVFHVPIGTWPKNKVLKTVGLYWRTILLDGIQAIALGPLTRGLRWNREQVELFLMDVRRAYHDNSALMYMPLHIIYAQKPESAV